MRAIALNIVILMYGMTFATVVVEASFLGPLGVELLGYTGDPLIIMEEDGTKKEVTPFGLLQVYMTGSGTLSETTANPQSEGEIVDRITFFSTAGFAAVWALILLLSGAYAFMWMEAMGIPTILVQLSQIIYQIAFAVTAIKYIRGVE